MPCWVATVPDGQYARLEAHGIYWTASDNDPITAPYLQLRQKAVKRSIVSPRARSRWLFPCVASGSEGSKFWSARSNRSGTRSAARSELLLFSRVAFSNIAGKLAEVGFEEAIELRHKNATSGA